MKKGLLVFLAVMLAIPVALAADHTVCSSGCDYTAITACLDHINGTAGTNKCSLVQKGATYTISASKIYTIDSPDYDGVIVIQNQSITLDCSNSIISGWWDSRGHGVLVDSAGSNFTIKNCKIYSYSFGSNDEGSDIFVQASGGLITNNSVTIDPVNGGSSKGGITLGGSNNRIINNSITNTNYYGLRIKSGSSNNLIMNNYIYGNGNANTDGILLNSAGTGNNFTNNQIIGNHFAGIRLANTDGTIINNNTIAYNTPAIKTAGDNNAPSTGDNNIITGNTIYGNADYTSISGTGNVFSYNDVNGSTVSINGGTISSNTLFNAAILVGSNSNASNNVIINGVASNWLLGVLGVNGNSRNTMLTNNTIMNSSGFGIGFGWNITSATIQYNNIYNCSRGITDNSAVYNSTIKSNTITDCGRGIFLEIAYGSPNIQVLSNTIKNSDEYGIGFFDYVGAIAQGNFISYSPKGIYLERSLNGTISQNTISHNTWGIYLTSDSNKTVISSNVFTSNGAGMNYSYFSSSYPRNWNSTNWTNTGASPGMILLFTTGSHTATLTSASTDVSSVVTGASDINLALLSLPSFGHLNITAIFDDSVATNCSSLQSFVSGLGIPGSYCAYFEPDAWIANGAGHDYTNSIDPTTTAVSGFYAPSLARAISPTSGAIYVVSPNNLITSNTFNSNTISITILSGNYNTLSGNTINLGNDLSLYIPGDVNVIINALIIGSAAGNYYLYKGSNTLNASNSRAGIRWTISNLSMNKNFGPHLLLGNGFVSLNRTALGDLDTKANVTLTGIACNNFKLWHTSGFYSNLADIMANGAIVATTGNIGSDCANTSLCKNVQCSNNVLTFEAQHFDGFGGEGSAGLGSGNVSINLTEEVSVLVRFNVNFGEGRVSGDNDSAVLDSSSTAAINGSWAFDRQFILINNDGTVNETINVTSDKAASAFIGGTGAEYKVKGVITEAGACPGVSLQSNYFEVLTTSQSLCSLLRFGVAFDQFNVSTKLRIPSDAAPGKKESTLTFTAKKA